MFHLCSFYNIAICCFPSESTQKCVITQTSCLLTCGNINLIVMPLLILTSLGPDNESIAIAGCVGSGAAGMNLLAVGGEKRNGT